jgi:uncharacterized protein YjiK
MTAVAVVCLAVTIRLMPKMPRDGAKEQPEAGVQAPEDGGTDAFVASGDAGTGALEQASAAAVPGGPKAAVARTPGYRVNMPDSTLTLPKSLNEISGLSVAADAQSLWAVHDERPTLFRLSVKDGSVVQELDLGKRGDYESVEEVGDFVYVGRSDGVLLVVDPSGKAPVTELNFTSRLGLACDLEGLGFEAKKNRLLLTCKNESTKSRSSNKAFEVYEVSLVSKEMKKEPAFVLEENAIDAYIAAHQDQPELKGAKGKSFAPSGVSVNPKTGELYMVSTRGKMLVVLNPEGTLVRVDSLDPEVHRQPEGISFAADGTLFISNEAHGRTAQVHVYKDSSTAAKE